MALPYDISFSNIASKIRDILIISSASIVVLTAVFMTLWKANQEDVRDGARIFLGVNELATKAQLAELVVALNRVTGKDRIIHRDPVFSYVKEPVRRDEIVTARYLLRTVPEAADCVAQTGIPLFTDERNTPIPGEMLSPIRQFSVHPTPVEMNFRQPVDLLDGRVCVIVAMTYDCQDGARFDQIDAVCYILQS